MALTLSRRLLAALLLSGVSPATLSAQATWQSVTGVVRRVGDGGAPVADAEVLLGNRQARTNAQGQFRIDSLPAGVYPLTVRYIGYRPVRARIMVTALAPTHVEYFLEPDPVVLPDIVVEARQEGIFGIVRTRELTPIAGATVRVIGGGGGTVAADSSGRFAVPTANNGVYMVRVTHPGHLERRLTLLVEKGKGRELSIELPVGFIRANRIEDAALFDLEQRLVRALPRDLLVEGDVRRYGSLAVCDIPRVRAHLRQGAAGMMGSEDRMLPGELCTWRADEVSLIELEPGQVRRGPRGSARGGGRVIIWPRW